MARVIAGRKHKYDPHLPPPPPRSEDCKKPSSSTWMGPLNGEVDDLEHRGEAFPSPLAPASVDTH